MKSEKTWVQVNLTLSPGPPNSERQTQPHSQGHLRFENEYWEGPEDDVE